MGIVRIVTDNYTEIDMGMASRGYMRTIPGQIDGEEQLYLLPIGTYWRAEPTDAEQLRIDAHAALQDAGQVGARIIATAGITSWHGLQACGDS